MKIGLMPGSLRRESLNKKLLVVASELLQRSGVETQLFEPKQYHIPVFDEDLEAEGLPTGVTALHRDWAACDAIIIASPEYNGGIPGPLKNMLDWLSRITPLAYTNKPLLVISASPGALGGIRAISGTKTLLENLGSFVFPGVFCLGNAQHVLEKGVQNDPATQARLEKILTEFMSFARKLSQ
jgi:NAD(P)H-dependent FMN reductase